MLTYVGLLVGGGAGRAVGPLTSAFSDKQLIFGSTVLMTVSLLAWALTPACRCCWWC